MQSIRTLRLSLFLVVSTLLIALAPEITAQVISYQGRLNQNGSPVNGNADVRFQLYDSISGGNPVGGLTTVPNVSVENGIFTAPLAASNVTDFSGLFLEIRVRVPAGSGSYTTLTPRQPITAAPFSRSTRGIFVGNNDDFVGINTTQQISGSDVFVISRDTSSFGGMYAHTSGSSGLPFYGYSAGGGIDAYTYFNGQSDEWRLNIEGADVFKVSDTGDVSIGNLNESVNTRLFVSDSSSSAIVAESGSLFGTMQLSNTNANGPVLRLNGDGSDTSALQIINDTNGAAQLLMTYDGQISTVGTITAFGGTGDGPHEFFRNTNSTALPENHVMVVHNQSSGSSPDVLALTMRNVNPGSASNFITFYDNNSGTLGSIQGDGAGGVEFAGPGNDYAEWLPKIDANETFEPGDVVGIVNGSITKDTSNATQIMVISTQPIVVGNRPREDDEGIDDHEKVAFIGQAPVRVLGPVIAGDFLIASGNNDGTAIAVSPANVSVEQLHLVIGTAWEDGPSADMQLVNTAIGIDREGALVHALRSVQNRMQQVENDIAAIRAMMEEK